VRAFFPQMEREHRRLAAQFRRGGKVSEQAQQELGERIGKLWDELQNKTNMIAEEEWVSHERELNRQIGVAKMISRISPVSSFVYIATDLAGTGVRKQLHFMRSLREYQKLFRQYIHEKTRGGLRGRGVFFGGRESEYDISDMPVFNYEGEPVSARIAGSILDFAMLGIEAVALFMAAFLSFLRVDVI